MASKKEPKAKAKKERVGKDDADEAGGASKKIKSAKVQSKATTKGGAAKRESKRDSAKQHRIRVPRKTDADGTADAGLDPFEVARQRVKGSVPAIVEAMVAKAKQGSCTHAKTLLEMTGAKHMFDGEGDVQKNSGEPWAKLVLERLDEAESCNGDAQEIGAEP